MKILLIRPQPGNDASAARAREAGFEAVQWPFFEVRARGWNTPDPASFDALLISSANAVRHAGAGLQAFRALPVHAVGSNSAKAVEAAGLQLATSGNEGVAAALQNAQRAGHRRLLWLTGEDQTAFDTPADMRIETRIVYASDPLPPGNGAQEAALAADIVALHSARAARHFAGFVDAAGLSRASIGLAAFSSAVAEAAGTGWRAVAIAARPDDRALLSAARALVKVPHNNRSQGDKD